MVHIPDEIDSKFRYIQIASQRALQLMKGADPRVDSDAAKAVLVAMEEVSAGKVDFVTEDLQDFDSEQEVRRQEWEEAQRAADFDALIDAAADAAKGVE